MKRENFNTSKDKIITRSTRLFNTRIPTLEKCYESLTRTPHSNTGTDFHKDKIALHICLLALVLENYQVRPEDLREDLHVPLSKVREYFRELGCVSRSSTDVVEGGNISTGTKKRKRTDIMVLQVPLVFPARRRAR